VNFTIKEEGTDKSGSLDFLINSSIGRLKSMAAKAIGSSLDYSVYLITEDAPEGKFVTRALLNEVGDSATILLAPKREADNREDA
jgi:hypothetical protein